jgi:hypothetical protein
MRRGVPMSDLIFCLAVLTFGMLLVGLQKSFGSTTASALEVDDQATEDYPGSNRDLIRIDNYDRSIVRLAAGGALNDLSFEDSLKHAKFANALEAHVERKIGHAVGINFENAVDAASKAKDILEFVRDRGVLVVQPSLKGEVMLALGQAKPVFDAAGKQLPQLRDRRGRIIEIMKSAPSKAKVANIALLVVNAAHMISAADVAKKLDSIGSNMDLLIEYRRIDQKAELERIYTSARELLADGNFDLTRVELWRLRGELRELRSSWRRELEHELGKIDEKKGWSFPFWNSNSKYDSGVAEAIVRGRMQIVLIEYGIRLDQVLAIAGEQADVAATTLRHEILELDKVCVQLGKKLSFIADVEKRKDPEAMFSSLDAVVVHYKSQLSTPIVYYNQPKLLQLS